MREQWSDLHVFWLNTGAAYDEVAAYMERIRALVPNFHEIPGAQQLSIEQFGWPADVVPVSATRDGHSVHGTKGLMFQSYLQCCARSIWVPMYEAMVKYGVTHIYRGQRRSDTRRAPITSGTVVDGITYLFPIEDWTREQVFSYCHEHCHEWIPPYYESGERTSRDCWNCTAYLDDNVERINALPTERRVAVISVINELRAVVARTMEV